MSGVAGEEGGDTAERKERAGETEREGTFLHFFLWVVFTMSKT